MTTAPSRSTETLDRERPKEITTLRPGRLVLKIEGPGHQTQVQVEQPCVTIGAHEDCAIVIDDPAISATHCELQLGEHGSMLRDRGSKNGTWYNDANIREVWLTVGQSFKIGNTVILLADITDVEVSISTQDHFGAFYGVGPIMGELFAKLERIADAHLDVMLTGEPSTGKGLLAQTIHEKSSRREGPFVVADCTSMDIGAIDAALFGTSDQPGALARANGGTLFIDGITSLSLDAQERLLRSLKSRNSSSDSSKNKESAGGGVDVRVISATSDDLLAMLAEGEFLRDLLYRVTSFRLDVPPLRDRNDGNVALLANIFLERMSEELGRTLSLDRDAYTLLDSHAWRGNALELANAIRAASLMVDEEVIQREDICLVGHQNPPTDEVAEVILPIAKVRELFAQNWDRARRQFGQLYATHKLTANGGSVLRAAFQAGVHRNTMTRLLRGDE